MLVFLEEPDADLLRDDLSPDVVLRGQAEPHLKGRRYSLLKDIATGQLRCSGWQRGQVLKVQLLLSPILFLSSGPDFLGDNNLI